MKKWIIILLLVAVAVAAGASTYYITQIRNQNNLLAYVPADTAYYFGGALSPEIMAFSLETRILCPPKNVWAILAESQRTIPAHGFRYF